MRNAPARIAALAAVVAIAAAACSGGGTGSAPPATSGAGGTTPPAAGGTVNIAVNPWVGYTASAAVVAHVLKEKLGYTVNLKDLKEDVSWQGFESGEVDVILEDWGHPELEKLYKRQVRHDPRDLDMARIHAAKTDVLRLGVFYKDDSRPRYDEIRRQTKHTAQSKLELLNKEFDRHAV